jgi:hypothetical protein
MTRNRERSSTGTYLISSYVVRTETDLRNHTTKSMLSKVVKAARKRFKFRFSKLQIQKNAFSMYITPREGNEKEISEILQWIKSVFAKAWNKIHKMRGTFWADRFDSELIMTEKIDETMETIIKRHLHCLLIVYSIRLHKTLRILKEMFIPTVVCVP